MAGLEPSAVGDPDGRSAKRAIQMHEFLMSGGIKVGEREGIATYSEPVDHTDSKWANLCPWHGDNCTAWNAIVSGNGYWTAMEAEIAALEALGAAENAAELNRLNELKVKLEMRPRDAKALRDRTPEMVAEERAHSIRAKAKRTAEFKAAAANALKIAESFKHGPNWKLTNAKGRVSIFCDKHKVDTFPQDGDVWTRVPSGKSQCEECRFEEAPAKAPVHVNERTGEVFDHDDWWNDGPQKPVKKFVPEKDSRDDAVAAFAGEAVPDTIEIEGDEGDEEAE